MSETEDLARQMVRDELARALFTAERGPLSDAEWSIVKEHANPAHSNWIRAEVLLDSPVMMRAFAVEVQQLRGEPSDAQVNAAVEALAGAWDPEDPRTSMRAALRAAGCVR